MASKTNDVWLMTVDPSKPKRSLTMCCFCVHLSVFLVHVLLSHRRENRGKRAYTCECCAKGGIFIVFNRWQLWRLREGVCMCVRGACWSVFFFCLSTSDLRFIRAASRMSAKMKGHTPLFTHSFSPYVSVYLLPHSVYSSITADSLSSFSVPFPFLSCKLPHSLSFHSVCWIHWCTSLIPLCCLPIFTWLMDSDLTTS